MGAPVGLADFRAAMARFPGAVTLVTALTPGRERRGITATAFASVTADPPSVLVCLNARTGTCAAVADTGRFAVNLLDGDGGTLALTFAGQDGRSGADKFERGNWGQDAFGLPRLEDAVVSLSCRVAETMTAGTHRIFIGRIEALQIGEGQGLVYEQSRFHGLIPRPPL